MPQGVGTYVLVGGQFDGFTGRETRARSQIFRPSRTDDGIVLVYEHEASFVDNSGALSHSVYRFSHEAPAQAATDEDG